MRNKYYSIFICHGKYKLDAFVFMDLIFKRVIVTAFQKLQYSAWVLKHLLHLCFCLVEELTLIAFGVFFY